MSIKSASLNNSRLVAGWNSALLLTGFGVAVLLRVLIGGVGVAQSPVAGLFFAVCLGLLCVAAKQRVKFSWRIAVIGITGGVLLCFPAIFVRLINGSTARPDGNYLVWGFVVSIVAMAEEAFFRGVLFGAIKKWRGETLAVIVSAVAFTALHVPLYGWHIIPLDLAVGLWLGALRVTSGSFIAPGIAHVIADLAGWWL